MKRESENYGFWRLHSDLGAGPTAIIESKFHGDPPMTLNEPSLAMRAENLREQGVEPDVTEAALQALRARQSAGTGGSDAGVKRAGL